MDPNITLFNPFFSIIIPSYNRPAQLAMCLEAMSRQKYPRERYEVIVIDDGSETPLGPVVDPFHDRLTVRLLVQQNSGPAAARNKGAAVAKGRFLVFTDDDCRPTPDWLTALARHYRLHPTPPHAVTGKTLNGLRSNVYSIASQCLVDYLYSYFNTDADQARFLTSNNLTLPVECFRDIGGFDTAFRRAAGEDRDLTERLREAGKQICYVPEVLIHHDHPLTFKAFLRQHFNYGRAAIRFHRLRAARRKTRMTIEPFPFYLNMVRQPFTHSGMCADSMVLAFLLAVTQLSNAGGFAWESFSLLMPGQGDTP
jgi:cellulose synthase/poly-beta-1,6-N-acetylglucosamine synthase-like glycosyltransferase